MLWFLKDTFPGQASLPLDESQLLHFVYYSCLHCFLGLIISITADERSNALYHTTGMGANRQVEKKSTVFLFSLDAYDRLIETCQLVILNDLVSVCAHAIIQAVILYKDEQQDLLSQCWPQSARLRRAHYPTSLFRGTDSRARGVDLDCLGKSTREIASDSCWYQRSQGSLPAIGAIWIIIVSSVSTSPKWVILRMNMSSRLATIAERSMRLCDREIWTHRRRRKELVHMDT